jgi:hypothetical protein
MKYSSQPEKVQDVDEISYNQREMKLSNVELLKEQE